MKKYFVKVIGTAQIVEFIMMSADGKDVELKKGGYFNGKFSLSRKPDIKASGAAGFSHLIYTYKYDKLMKGS